VIDWVLPATAPAPGRRTSSSTAGVGPVVTPSLRFGHDVADAQTRKEHRR